MTKEEAIKRIKDHIQVHKIGDYPHIYLRESLDMAIEALEKQIPKQPIEDGYYDEPCVCPNCGSTVINEADNDYNFDHCYYCGQALCWDNIN
jgi:hypothetical protein